MPVTQTEILQGQVINTFLAATRLPAFSKGPYFVDGVMQMRFEWHWDHMDRLSAGERQVFAVAKEIWNWDAQVRIFDLCNTLDYALVQLVFELYLAFKAGPEALIDWVAKYSDLV
jgi:hypothetical protein